MHKLFQEDFGNFVNYGWEKPDKNEGEKKPGR